MNLTLVLELEIIIQMEENYSFGKWKVAGVFVPTPILVEELDLENTRELSGIKTTY